MTKKLLNDPKHKIYAVDLFCGAGGLSYGLRKSGVDVRLGVDIDPVCRYPYTANNQAEFLLKSVEELQPNDIRKAFRKNGICLLAGCAPCQTFSSYNQKATSEDSRWWLLLQFARLIRTTKPQLVTMENVPGLIEQDVFKKFVTTLKQQDYYLDYRVINCKDFGIPQNRRRLVLLASRLGPISVPSPLERKIVRRTVWDSIRHLPNIKAGEICSHDPLHQSPILSSVNLKRIKKSKPGGTWRDWDVALRAKCHKKKRGSTYPSVYGRMDWDEPAPTITTQFFGYGNGRFGHPEQNRAISLREGAILQSFPDDYKFVPPGERVYKKVVGRMIGNSVPPALGEVIGHIIRKHVAQWEQGLLVLGPTKYI